MHEQGISIPALVVVWFIAAAVLFAVARAGWFAQRAFERSPRRETGLTAMDLPVGVLVLMAAMLVAEVGIRWVFPELALDEPTDDPVNPRVALAYLLGQVLSFGPVALFTLTRARGRGQSGGTDHRLGMTPRRMPAVIVWTVGGFVVVVCWVSALNLLAQLIAHLFGTPMPEVAHELLERMVSTPSALARWTMIASAVILAPLLEEIIYRGLVQTTLLELFGRGRRWAVIIAASILFTGVHLSAVRPAANAGYLPLFSVLATLFLLAVVLGFVYERTGSLWPCILIHVLFNATNILIATAAFSPEPS